MFLCTTELVYAAETVSVSLCTTSEKTISAVERDLPKNLCPLIKASYGYAITDTCPFFIFLILLWEKLPVTVKKCSNF
ncbi:2-hydroxyacyl-CoA dehydratase family protein [Treponema pedis]|uniref:2-hydroxyacyl-CoA dehydratase family protein n=1 Tax=Treponema pedis TaxID=409322 RepID=UPI0021F2551F|nr:2-hydroxyacyl-CoA dehydratase family protein [Treponema pedis]